MHRLKRALLCAALLQLSACANFAAVKSFSDDTSKLASTAAAEIQFVAADCDQLAQARHVVEGVALDTAQCDKLKKSTTNLAGATTDVLTAYAQKLGAVANDKTFDYGPNLEKTKSALVSLKDRDGASVLDKNVAGSAIGVADVIFDVATQSQRSEAVRRLVAARADLVGIASYLKIFFVGGVAQGKRWPSPYRTQLAEDLAGLRDLSASIRSNLLAREPIRSREWLDEIQKRTKAIDLRLSGAGKKIADSLDAWVAAFAVFQKKALEPTAPELIANLRTLRTKAIAAREATRAAGE